MELDTSRKDNPEISPPTHDAPRRNKKTSIAENGGDAHRRHSTASITSNQTPARYIPSSPMVRCLRTGSQSGVWCSLLLPALLFSAYEDGDTHSLFKGPSLLLSCFLSAASIVTAYHLVYSPTAAEEGDGGGVARYLAGKIVSDLFERESSKEVRIQRKQSRQQRPSTMAASKEDFDRTNSSLWLSSGLILTLVLQGDATAPVCCLALLCVLSYHFLLPRLFYSCPRSFTFGEGCLVLQALTLYAFEATGTLVYLVDDTTTIQGSFSFITKCGLCSCLLFCSLPLLPPTRWVGRPAAFLAAGAALLLGVTLPALWWRLRRDPVSWVLGTIFDSTARAALFGFWSLCLLAAVAVVGVQPEEKKASTRVRKYFHLLIVMVHTSGVLVDPEFLYLSSIVAISFFVLLEATRVYKIEPFSSFFNSCLGLFLDEKDSGPLILTHIYLLCGCSMPLWVSHDLAKVSKVRLLSGVLSVGVGDSAASVIGSKVGRTKFPDSEKSVEGTAAAAASQLLFLWALQRAGLIPTQDWTYLYMPVFIVSLVEALTVQVDNLVLPIVLYVLL